MRRLSGLAVVLATALVLPAAANAQNTIRLILSAGDPGVLPTTGGQATPQPPELTAPLAPIPTLGASARLHIWGIAETGASTTAWSAVSFNIDIDGPATLSNLVLYNPTHLGTPRWNAGGLFTPALSAGGTEYNNIVMLAASEYGLRRLPYPDGYTSVTTGFPNAGAPVLLGSFDVTFNPTTLAAVWLEVGGMACDSNDGVPTLDRVRLSNAEGAASLAVNAAPGSRGVSPAAIFNIEAPGGFEIVSPDAGRYLTTASPKLQWTNADRVHTYSVQIGTTPTLTSPVFTQTGIVGTSFSVPSGVLTTGVYYWSVTAHNTGGATGATGGSRDFGIIVGGGNTCAADFDDDGQRTVGDIFAFLEAWFAGCP